MLRFLDADRALFSVGRLRLHVLQLVLEPSDVDLGDLARTSFVFEVSKRTCCLSVRRASSSLDVLRARSSAPVVKRASAISRERMQGLRVETRR